MKNYAFNRTSMESKLASCARELYQLPFNRTSMESKLKKSYEYERQACKLLIEPVWNRNPSAHQLNARTSNF